MTKTTPPPLTLAETIRTHAAVFPVVSINVSAEQVRSIARALEAQEEAAEDAVRISAYNQEQYWDKRADQIYNWSLIALCLATANQLAGLFEVLM